MEKKLLKQYLGLLGLKGPQVKTTTTTKSEGAAYANWYQIYSDEAAEIVFYLNMACSVEVSGKRLRGCNCALLAYVTHE